MPTFPLTPPQVSPASLGTSRDAEDLHLKWITGPMRCTTTVSPSSQLSSARLSTSLTCHSWTWPRPSGPASTSVYGSPKTKAQAPPAGSALCSFRQPCDASSGDASWPLSARRSSPSSLHISLPSEEARAVRTSPTPSTILHPARAGPPQSPAPCGPTNSVTSLLLASPLPMSARPITRASPPCASWQIRAAPLSTQHPVDS